MFDSDTIDKQLYSEIMEQIKQINRDRQQSPEERSARRAQRLKIICRDIRSGHFSIAADRVKRFIRQKISKGNRLKKIDKGCPDRVVPADYFSSERIAIYTVIIGDYDDVLEPYCKPDNCDYFLFTDKDFDDAGSTWEKRDLPECLDGLTSIERNRWLKMHPHKVFGEYKYSVYVDGNIQIFTDLTEYINKLGPTGIGIHLHPDRHCAYEELKAVVERGKETKENTQRHARYMEEMGMPHDYGLLECNVIAREHNNDICVQVMEQWWQEFMEYSKRDQISLPHVLYRNHISVAEVGVLGDNVRINPSFRIFRHKELPRSGNTG